MPPKSSTTSIPPAAHNPKSTTGPIRKSTSERRTQTGPYATSSAPILPPVSVSAAGNNNDGTVVVVDDFFPNGTSGMIVGKVVKAIEGSLGSERSAGIGDLKGSGKAKGKGSLESRKANRDIDESAQAPPTGTVTLPLGNSPQHGTGQNYPLTSVPLPVDQILPPPPTPLPTSITPTTTNPTITTTNTNTSKSTPTSTNPLPTTTSRSCRECSRLKIRCTRSPWPCTSCIRRGVDSICPNGKMEAGKGRRLILSDSKELMGRIGVLERALRESHEEVLRGRREKAGGGGKMNKGGKKGEVEGVVEEGGGVEGEGEDGGVMMLVHPALMDAYHYSPKDTPMNIPGSSGNKAHGKEFTPMSAGVGSSSSGLRDIRDVIAEEGGEEGGDYDAGEQEDGEEIEGTTGRMGKNGKRTILNRKGKRVKLEPGTLSLNNPTSRPKKSSLSARSRMVNDRNNNNTTGRNVGGEVLEGEDGEDEDAEISLGTLTIGAQGEAVYVGSAGGSSFLHENGPSPPLTATQAFDFRLPNRSRPTRHSPHHSLSISQSFADQPSSSTGNIDHQIHPSTSNNHHYQDPSSPPPPEDIQNTYPSILGDFPFVPGQSSLTLSELWRMIPAWEEGDEDDTGNDGGGRMADDERSVLGAGAKMNLASYWLNCDWMYNCLPRQILDSDYLPAVYESQTPPSPHKLACVYLVMALGVMFDLEHREPYDPLAGELFRLGVACLTVNGALSRPTIATVQALNLMGNFMLNDKPVNGANAYWPFLGVAANCVTALGLHRDGTNFDGLSPFEIEERRKVFWEMTTLDRLQAMCFARPCSLSNRSIDSLFPGEGVEDEDHKLPDPDGYNTAKYQLVKLMDLVIEEQTRTKKGTYQTVLSIDKEITDFRKNLPEMMLPDKKASALEMDVNVHPHVMMHRFSIRLLVCETRIYLHRLYFTKALNENPSDPSHHDTTFGKSFLAVFESAVELIAIVRQCVIYHPALTSRWWFFWFHAFSAAVCLAAVCIKAPSSAFASPAYMALVMSCDIASAAVDGTKAKGGLPVLLRLRQRASNAMLSIGAVHTFRAHSSATPRDAMNTSTNSHETPPARHANYSSPTTSNLGSPPNQSTSSSHGSTNKQLADDDLSHLSNRPQLRRVNVDMTSPMISTPTLTTDGGRDTGTTGSAQSGASGNSAERGGEGNGLRIIGGTADVVGLSATTTEVNHQPQAFGGGQPLHQMQSRAPLPLHIPFEHHQHQLQQERRHNHHHQSSSSIPAANPDQRREQVQYQDEGYGNDMEDVNPPDVAGGAGFASFLDNHGPLMNQSAQSSSFSPPDAGNFATVMQNYNDREMNLYQASSSAEGMNWIFTAPTIPEAEPNQQHEGYNLAGGAGSGSAYPDVERMDFQDTSSHQDLHNLGPQLRIQDIDAYGILGPMESFGPGSRTVGGGGAAPGSMAYNAQNVQFPLSGDAQDFGSDYNGRMIGIQQRGQGERYSQAGPSNLAGPSTEYDKTSMGMALNFGAGSNLPGHVGGGLGEHGSSGRAQGHRDNLMEGTGPREMPVAYWEDIINREC